MRRSQTYVKIVKRLNKSWYCIYQKLFRRDSLSPWKYPNWRRSPDLW